MKTKSIKLITILLSLALIIVATGLFVTPQKAYATEVIKSTIDETETPEIDSDASQDNGAEDNLESKLPTADEVIDTMTDNDLFQEEDVQMIKGWIAKLEAYTSQSDSFFVRYILPILIAIVLVFLFSIILLTPFIRNKSELKTVKSMFTNLKAQYNEKKEEVKELKASLETETIKEEIKVFISEELLKLSILIKDSLNKDGVELDKIETQLSALISGALNAWKGSPEAIDKLTQSANANQLKNLAEQNAKLTAFIYHKYGEEASEIIKTL